MNKLTEKQKRCQDCACLIIQKGQWCCDECFGQPCELIDDCPEGIELSEISEIEEKTKNIKVNHGAKAEKSENKPKKPKTVKISDEKQALFNELREFLTEKYENVEILTENKLFCVKINDKSFKIDIIQQRAKKG